MRFGGFDKAEDAQEDAFRIVVLWIVEASVALRDMNLEALERNVSCLLIMGYPLMKDGEMQAVKARRDSIRSRLYSKPRPNAEERSQLLLELEELLEIVVNTLNVAGILYRSKADMNSMAAR